MLKQIQYASQMDNKYIEARLYVVASIQCCPAKCPVSKQEPVQGQGLVDLQNKTKL